MSSRLIKLSAICGSLLFISGSVSLPAASKNVVARSANINWVEPMHYVETRSPQDPGQLEGEENALNSAAAAENNAAAAAKDAASGSVGIGKRFPQDTAQLQAEQAEEDTLNNNQQAETAAAAAVNAYTSDSTGSRKRSPQGTAQQAEEAALNEEVEDESNATADAKSIASGSTGTS